MDPQPRACPGSRSLARRFRQHLHRGRQSHQLIILGAGAGERFERCHLAPVVETQRMHAAIGDALQRLITEMHVHGQAGQQGIVPIEPQPPSPQLAPARRGLDHLKPHAAPALVGQRQEQPADPRVQGPQGRRWQGAAITVRVELMPAVCLVTQVVVRFPGAAQLRRFHLGEDGAHQVDGLLQMAATILQKGCRIEDAAR